MTETHPGGMSATLTRLDRNVAELSSTVASLLDDLEDLRTRVARVEAAGVARAPDALNDEIAAFLDTIPGVKMSAVSIAENVGAAPQKVADRATTLANQGRIAKQSQPGRNPLYYSRKKAPK